MVTLRRKRKSKVNAPALVIFTSAKNETGKRQPCVFAECTYGGTRAGPIWGHSAASVRRLLATLSKSCDCGRRYHKSKMTEGVRVVTHGKPD